MSATFRERLLEGLGGPWPESCALNVCTREVIQENGFTIESLFYDAEPGDPVPALLLIPDEVSAKSPAPGIAIPG